MFQNIILLILIILLFFFISNEQKISNILQNKSVKYLFLLLIIYFIYENYNLILLIVAILVVIYFNIDFKEKFINNKYLSIIKESFSNIDLDGNDENEGNDKNIKIEPFKQEVVKIRDLFENIKMEIKKIV